MFSLYLVGREGYLTDNTRYLARSPEGHQALQVSGMYPFEGTATKQLERGLVPVYPVPFGVLQCGSHRVGASFICIHAAYL